MPFIDQPIIDRRAAALTTMRAELAADIAEIRALRAAKRRWNVRGFGSAIRARLATARVRRCAVRILEGKP